MSIYRVPPSFLADIWPAIERHVSRACEHHPFMDAADVRAVIEAGKATLFIGTENGAVLGFCAVEVVKYPSRTVANVLGIGGERGFLAVAINELVQVVVDFGKTQGATVVALSGRPGWLRALRHLGGESKRFITMWADIDGRRRRRYQDNHDSVGTSATLPT